VKQTAAREERAAVLRSSTCFWTKRTSAFSIRPMPTFRSGRSASIVAAAALMLVALAPSAHAAAPVVRLKASVSPSRIPTAHGSVGTPVNLHIDTTFATDTPGAELFTIQKSVVWFPAGVGIPNGKLFASCSASQISRAGGVLSRCPKGSRVGGGTVRAKAIQLGVTSSGKVAIFNGPHGRSVTFNIQASIPANINESFDAPIVRVHGKYGYKLTLPVPHSLQEIITGVFVGIIEFNVTTNGTTRVHGRKRGFIEALKCPKSGGAPLHGDFDFEDWSTGQTASTKADTTIRCKHG
jgi:hypothetical protein